LIASTYGDLVSDKDLDRSPNPPLPPRLSAEEKRKARLDAALRDNLRRRKQQVRNRGLDDASSERDTPSIFKSEDDRTRSK
jgi:hypothetical protein